jgi:uncharacterized protein with HEPN domain
MSDAFCQQHPEIPWASMIGMRNVLSHMYFAIDTEVVWSVVENDLPPLKVTIIATLQHGTP